MRKYRRKRGERNTEKKIREKEKELTFESRYPFESVSYNRNITNWEENEIINY